MTGVRVGIVGTGEMGQPLIGRLAAADHDVTAFVRRPEMRAQLRAAGFDVTDTLAGLASCEVVLVYVFSDEQAREVVLEGGLLTAMAPGSTLVIHTTGSPVTARDIARTAQPYQVNVVDAPGSGGPAQVADGTLTLFVGGDEPTVDRLRPLFACYATTVVRFGPVGAGQAVKLINNLLFAAHVQLAIEAARLAEPFGIDVLAMADTLRAASGASAPLGMIVNLGSAEGLLQAGGPFIHKDALLAQQLAAEAGISLGSFARVIQDVVDSTGPYSRP
jgi:3-hydroxyisobutyrate dehydrogenase-like beta-hydroxyacid dehydrogenase